MPLSPYLSSVLGNAALYGLPSAALGAGVGALRPGEDSHGHRRSRLRGALIRGAASGLTGAVLGGFQGHQQARDNEWWAKQDWTGAGARRPGAAPSASPLESTPWARGAKTQAEVKQRHRAAARQNHPDMGGSEEAMKRVNLEWEALRNHPDFRNLKEAYDAGSKVAAAMFGLTSQP